MLTTKYAWHRHWRERLDSSLRGGAPRIFYAQFERLPRARTCSTTARFAGRLYAPPSSTSSRSVSRLTRATRAAPGFASCLNSETYGNGKDHQASQDGSSRRANRGGPGAVLGPVAAGRTAGDQRPGPGAP